MGDALRGGKLDPAFQVFSVYKKRVDQRVKYARDLLKQDFDFAGSDKFSTTARTCRGLPTTSSWTCCGASR